MVNIITKKSRDFDLSSENMFLLFLITQCCTRYLKQQYNRYKINFLISLPSLTSTITVPSTQRTNPYQEVKRLSGFKPVIWTSYLTFSMILNSVFLLDPGARVTFIQK